ncbi:MAG: histidine kinase, partial [Desulfobacteraceae bacterium]|nr:histidine kinase [Desulfobacteraceae bacterium]
MAAITVAGGIIMLWYTYKIDNMLVTMVQKEIVLYKAAQEMELALANQKGFLTYYFVDGNDQWLESLGRYREIFRKSLDKAYSLQLNEQQKEHLKKISL